MSSQVGGHHLCPYCKKRIGDLHATEGQFQRGLRLHIKAKHPEAMPHTPEATG